MSSAISEVDIITQAINRTFEDPAWFFENVLRSPILPWQLKSIEAVLDVERFELGLPTKVNHLGLKRISIRSCHGTGKTHDLACIAHLWSFIHMCMIAITAPKEKQLTKRFLPRYRKVMNNADPSYREMVDVQGTEVIWGKNKDWGLTCETATDPDNLAGYHDTPQLFLIDEASAKRLDPMYQTIEGALTTPGSVLVEIGNPTRMEGEFYKHHNDKKIKELYYLMHIKAEDAPELITQEWQDTMAIKYGIDSPVYKIRVLGEFASFDDCVLIPLPFIDDAIGKEWADDGSLRKLRITADIADGGTDQSSVTVAWHYDSFVLVVKQKLYNYAPHESPVEMAKVLQEMWKGYGGSSQRGDDIVVDANGVGSGTAGILMDKKLPVKAYKGSHKSIDYRNMRVQSYFSTYEQFRDGKVVIEEDALEDEDLFTAHMTSIKRTENEKDDIETKLKMKKDGLPSPDCADSMAMHFYDYKPTDLADTMIPQVIGVTETSHDDSSLT